MGASEHSTVAKPFTTDNVCVAEEILLDDRLWAAVELNLAKSEGAGMAKVAHQVAYCDAITVVRPLAVDFVLQ